MEPCVLEILGTGKPLLDRRMNPATRIFRRAFSSADPVSDSVKDCQQRNGRTCALLASSQQFGQRSSANWG
ncbi:MAG: hypothetical protein A3H27_11170 [Acidobacteria bacterium RIFCSPLOWO2_02_FULL_59_13]|nr:MAG: hypothetical protein A3H27_11170 [Acidobacteria bacterium RIFCSPLOWO2_02_FULL_59_13]